MNEASAANGRRLGEWLRAVRQAKETPLRVVAAAADMDTALLSKIELGQRLPTEEQTDRLARFLGLDAEALQARRIADRFRQEYQERPAAKAAIMMLAEEAGVYRTRTGR